MLDEHWIARDADGELWLYFNKPQWMPDKKRWQDDFAYSTELDGAMFQIIKPGECRHYVETENDNA